MPDLKEITEEIRTHSRSLVREWDVLKGCFQDTSFTYSQCHILFELQKHQQLNLMQLAEIVQLDKANASRTVKSLVKMGLIKIDKNPADQRQKLLSLTKEGQKATNQNNHLASSQVESALNLLAPEERESVRMGLELYSKALLRSRKQSEFQALREFCQTTKSDNAFAYS